MASGPTVDIAELIERQKLSRFIIRLVLVSWLVTFFDGFDMNVIAFAAPYLAPDLHLDKLMLGNVFSAAVFGILIGSFLFGYLADKFGRRRAIIFAVLTFSVFTLSLVFAKNYEEWLVLRFVAGIGLGGAIPLSWTLNIEYAPVRFRATIVTVIMVGYGLGVTCAGPIAIFLIPKFGWSSVFVFGGLASLLSAFLLFLWLPESLRFLVVNKRPADKIVAAAAAISDRPLPEDAHYVLVDEHTSREGFVVKRLFEGALRWITPAIWIGYLFSSVSTFLMSSWGPIIFEGVGFSRDDAAWVTSLNGLAGMAGGLILMRFTDRLGPTSIAVMAAASVPLLFITAFGGVSLPAFIALSFATTICLGGSHYGITSITGVFYPSAIRGNGTGLASAIAKIGSIAGPIVGGMILASAMPVRHLFAVIAICPIVFALAMLAIAAVRQRKAGTEANLSLRTSQ